MGHAFEEENGASETVSASSQRRLTANPEASARTVYSPQPVQDNAEPGKTAGHAAVEAWQRFSD